MERGTSATGIAYQDNGSIRIRKSEGPADKFLEAIGDKLSVMARSPRGLIHARATTKGSEKQSENNHPVTGFNWAVVHNGMVSNDDDVWGYYTKKDHVKRFAEVDTSAIPLVLGRGKSLEESIRNLSILGGSLTIAAWSSHDIERMILARFGYNDLYLFYDQSDNIMYWSSASSASYTMHGPTFGRHKFLSFSKLADEHVLVLQPGGFTQTRVFKVERRPFFLPHAVSYMGTPSGATTGTKSPASVFAEQAAPTPKTIMNHIWVSIPPLSNQKKLTLEWKPLEERNKKPQPMYQYFTRSWCSVLYDLEEYGKTKTGHTLFTGYGRWVLTPLDSGVQRSFLPYKRTKVWWSKAYKTAFALPLVRDTNGLTTHDDILSWEHYDIDVQLLDNSTRRFLGFMCPVCGVWLSSVSVQQSRGRCEYCNIHHRLYPEVTAEAPNVRSN
jgi:hypothetical protein